MEHKMILIVEDYPDDEALTIRALRKNNIGNRVVEKFLNNFANILKY